MENTLTQLDGKILLVGLLALIIVWILGWVLGWVFYRAKAREILAQSRAEAEAKAANVEALKHDLAQRDRLVGESNETIASFVAERAEFERKIQSQHGDVSDLTAKIEMLETSQNETDSNDENLELISALEASISNLQARLSSQKQQQEKYVAKLMSEKALETQELGHLKSQNFSLTERITGQENTISQLTVEAETAVSELGKHKKDTAAEKATADTHAGTVNQLKDKLSQLTQIKDKNLGEISNLQSSLTIWQNKAANAEIVVRESNQQLRLLEKQIANPDQDSPSYDRLLEIKEQEILQQKNHTHLAQKQLVAVRDEVVSREEDLEQLRALINKQKIQQRHELSLMTRNLQQQELAATSALDEYIQKNRRLTQEVEKLTQEHAAISRKLLNATSSINDLRDGNRSLRSEFNAAEENLGLKQGEIDSLAHTTRELEKSVAGFKQEFEETRTKLRQTNKDLQAKVSANEHLRGELAIQLSAKQELEHTPKVSAAKNKDNLVGEQSAPLLLAEKPARVDDLKEIKGIGPRLEKLLNEVGIYQFSQLANLNSSEMAWVDEHIETFKGRIYRDEWVRQAKQLS